MNNKISINICQQLNFKNKINKQNRTGVIDTENTLTAARWEGVGRLGGKGERIKKYKLVVTEQSWGCKVQQREHMVPDGYEVYWDDHLVSYIMSNHRCTAETNIILYVNCN